MRRQEYRSRYLLLAKHRGPAARGLYLAKVSAELGVNRCVICWQRSASSRWLRSQRSRAVGGAVGRASFARFFDATAAAD